MREQWIQPRAVVQEFVPNEYVAACGDSGKVYNFKCDAPGGPLYIGRDEKEYWWEPVWNCDNTYLGSYNPCSIKHQADSSDDFYKGFIDNNDNKWYDPDTDTAVIVWRGPDGDNGHATTNLDMSTWETEKS